MASKEANSPFWARTPKEKGHTGSPVVAPTGGLPLGQGTSTGVLLLLPRDVQGRTTGSWVLSRQTHSPGDKPSPSTGRRGSVSLKEIQATSLRTGFQKDAGGLRPCGCLLNWELRAASLGSSAHPGSAC